MSTQAATVKITSTDYEQYAVVYQCTRIHDDGSCEGGSASVDILTRSAGASLSSLAGQIRDTVWNLCPEPGDFVEDMQEDTCEMKSAAYLKCPMEDLPKQSNFSMEMFTGTWFAVTRLDASIIRDSWQIRVTQQTSGQEWDIAYTGLNMDGCFSKQTAVIEYSEAGDLIVNYTDRVSGKLRILYCDYDLALVYQCFDELTDGTCRTGLETLSAYSRTPTLPPDIRDKLMPLVNIKCFETDDFQLVAHDERCDMEQPADCLARNIPSERDFQLEKFLGRWYGIYRLRASHVLEDFVMSIELGADRIIRLYYTGVRDNTCQSTSVLEIPYPRDINTATWWYDRQGTTGVIKIIATDYRYAILYVCDQVRESGQCDRTHLYVNVLSRYQGISKDGAVERMKRLVKQTCFQPGELVQSELKQKCSLSIQEVKTCRYNDIVPIQDFDANKIAGVWHGYGQLRDRIQYDTGSVVMVPGPNGSLLSVSYPVVAGQCIPPVEYTMMPVGDTNVGEFTAGNNNVRIIYMDDSVVFMVSCSRREADGSCASGANDATALSRTSSLPAYSRAGLRDAAEQACIAESEFVRVNAHNCPITYTGRRSCRVEDIVTQENYDISQLYGTWNLLAKTAGVYNRQTVVKFSLGREDTVRFVIATKRAENNCVSAISHLEKVKGQDATYTSQYGVARALSKVLYLTSAYMVKYDCAGVSLDKHGLCPPDREDIKIWGRTSFVTSDVVEQLLSNIKSQVCVDVGSFVLTPVEVDKCELPPEACNFYDFVEAETPSMKSILGGWQLLMRTTIVPLNVVSLSAHISERGSPDRIHLAIAATLNSGQCIQQGTDYDVDPQHSMTAFSLRPDGSQYVLKVLYVDSDHLILMVCRSRPGDGGVCPLSDTELNVFGRGFSMEQSTRERLVRIARERTLQCVPARALMDATPNENCQLAQEHCSTEDFHTPVDFDQRHMYGHWYLSMASTFVTTSAISASIRYGHGVGDSVFTCASSVLRNTGECSSNRCASVANIPGQMQAYRIRMENGAEFEMKVLHLTTEHLIVLNCIDGFDREHRCPLASMTIDIFSRSREVTSEVKDELLLLVRQKTLSCVPTTTFVTTQATDCKVAAPLGREDCTFDDIQAVQNLNMNMLLGGWYVVFRTDSTQAREYDGGVLQVTANSQNIYYSLNVHNPVEPRKCISAARTVVEYGTDLAIQKYNPELGQFDTATTLVLHADADSLVRYTCFGEERTMFGTCPQDHESVVLYSRRKGINTAARRELMRVVGDRACVSEADFIPVNHTNYCEFPGVTDLAHLEGKSCRVDDYPVQEDFQQEKFTGTWYEVERTRYTSDNVWESIVARFDPAETEPFLRLVMSGTRSGSCMGPFEAHVKPTSDNDPDSADMTMWIGSIDSYGHPWSIRMKYKVIYTDYQTAIVYTCRHANADGICERRAEQLDLLSRSPVVAMATRERLHNIVKERLCVDVHDLVIPAKEADCLDFVHTPTPATPDSLKMSADPVPTCFDLMCLSQCDHGYQKDEHGCDTCKCEEESGLPSLPSPQFCAIPMCANFCEHGYRRNEQGCETCDCQSPPLEVSVDVICLPFHCDLQCPSGYATNRDGCGTCACAEDVTTDPSGSLVTGIEPVVEDGEGLLEEIGKFFRMIVGYFT